MPTFGEAKRDGRIDMGSAQESAAKEEACFEGKTPGASARGLGFGRSCVQKTRLDTAAGHIASKSIHRLDWERK
jgi:hypothetical protein